MQPAARPLRSRAADGRIVPGLTARPNGCPTTPGRAPAISTSNGAQTASPLARIECDEDARRVAQAVLAGDRNAFAELVERELHNVTRVCYRILGDRDDAEEATQEAFLAAYRTLPAWRGEGPFGAWVARIALHIALRRRRHVRPVAWIDAGSLDGLSDVGLGDGGAGSERRVAQHFRAASADAAMTSDPAEIAVTVEREQRVRHALLALEEPYRETVALRYFAGLTVPEIAEVCCRPQGTVKTHLHRGLLRLRGRLDDVGVVR